MKKVLVSVISANQLVNAKMLMNSAEKYMFNWDRIVYVLDYSQDVFRNFDSGLKDFAAVLPASQLIGPDYLDLAFFFTRDELAEYVKVYAIRKLLNEYDFIILSDCESVFLNQDKNLETTLDEENSVISMVKTRFEEKGVVPKTFLITDKKHQSRMIGFSKGAVTKSFVDFCISKFEFLVENAISALNHSNSQAAFIFSWQQYTDFFNLNLCCLSEKQYIRLQTNEKAKDLDEAVYVCFDGSVDLQCNLQNSLIGMYSYNVDNLKKRYNLEARYTYDYFTDGTKIIESLRPYYFLNYRLRDNCKLNPFNNRLLFTDASIIVGDEFEVPLPAIADCIWKNRIDLQTNYPRHDGANRIDYMLWFVKYASSEYKLSKEYTIFTELKLEGFYSGLESRTSSLQFLKRVKNKLSISKKIDFHKFSSGVNLCGFIKGEFGLGEAARIMARTLEAGDIPFTIVDYQTIGLHRYMNREWDHKISNSFQYNTNVIIMNGFGISDFRRTVSDSTTKDRYNIGFMYWELPECPDSWVDPLSYFDEIWVASEFVANAFRKKIKQPVYCVPCSVTTDYRKDLDRQYFDLPDNVFLFLMMYDVKSNNERKNPMAAIRAFVSAFDERKDVAMVIKISGEEEPDLVGQLKNEIREHSNLIVLFGTYDKIVVNALINCCDAFVSLHRSEGFGLGPAEAMYLGKPAILTNWSGNKTYMTKDNCCAVNYNIIEIDQDFGPYQKGGNWAEPDIEHAAKLMRKLVDEKEFYNRIAENGQRHIREYFSPLAVSKIAKDRLTQIGLL